MTNIFKLSLLLFASCIAAKAQTTTAPYKWKNVHMVGGGFVDGVIFHPTAKGVRYCRTDMGGAYRWNEALKQWDPILDHIADSDNNLMGVESIAVDAADPNKVYLACGTYTNSKGPNAILRSADQGKTFSRTDVPFRMGGNENGRGNGERLAVDPNNGNIIYMGTRRDGLWKSADAGTTWKQVNTFPDITNDVGNTVRIPGISRAIFNGIVFIKFDTGKGRKGLASPVIYAGVSAKGVNTLYRSTDAGTSWQPVAGQPQGLVPTRCALSIDGSLYITYCDSPGPSVVTNGAVWKLDTKTNEWTDITPDKPDAAANRRFGYAAVSVDAHHPKALIVSTFNRYGKTAGGEDIFRSIDGGKSWKPVFTGAGNGKFDNAISPYIAHTGIHWLFDVEIDPANPNHALFTTGYGGHETFNLTDMDKGAPTIWYPMSSGIEETVGLDMISPPQGAPLISAIGDYGGFVHHDLDVSPPEGNFTDPHFANTNSIAFAEKKPQVMVRVGEGSTQVGGGNIGYSLNGGKSWKTTLMQPRPGAKGGYVTISAGGGIWVWSLQNGPAYYTTDNGNNWTLINAIPNNIRIVADRENADKFYAVNLIKGIFYISTDGCRSFRSQKLNVADDVSQQIFKQQDKRQGTNQLYTVAAKDGDIWLPTVDALYHSTNSGENFTKVGDIQQIKALGFGKAATGVNYPALYIIGSRNGLNGIYRSVDMAKSWVRINDDQHQWGLLLRICGDPKTFGRVYVGTHGRGIIYGDPADDQQ